ncbi:hypothetical protein ASPBRDRAFT_54263 [Aspergillus brasiliensis CBS 101740]|uniref:Uncharacterized protein n=1 Tax=Aspergillus brasiliensis (strain CBS 101740 / IMI 381727 / IBT 21946) TaxID=767769 RepID=A0A1L9UL84_ASPBC|nr:hypothetical protein ASPBRDRAFT_54263 [Aspergillus brasiliensis CBS 101740]
MCGYWAMPSSYLNGEDESHPFPQQAIDLGSLVSQTPPFLGGSTASSYEKIAFACEENQSMQGKGSLVVNCRSTWRTSTTHRVSVKLSADAPFSDWPGVEGLAGYDEGDYLPLLFLTWAYILSARWAELLERSVDHECQMSYTAQSCEGSVKLDKQHTIHVDIDDNACEEEVLWWRAILYSGNGWDATTKYNGHEYLSPWSLSVTDAGLTPATKDSLITRANPPDSWTALEYLRRFCVHHHLYAPCSVVLAGQSFQLMSKEGAGATVSISELLNEHGQLLVKSMTLSSNVWGLRSILCSTFFNNDIECNIVSERLNPNSTAALLINRQPRLGILWLGALLTDLAKSILRDVRAGMTALDLLASAWTETTQSFLTSEIGPINGEWIPRDDECRLLFITASEEYSSEQTSQPADGALQHLHNRDYSVLEYYTYNFVSQSLSECASRGIFERLRSTGYPSSERPIYQHSWIDIEDTDDEEAPDDEKSDIEIQYSPRKINH